MERNLGVRFFCCVFLSFTGFSKTSGRYNLYTSESRRLQWIGKPEVRVKCVCQGCDNGWMSAIENENKPHMLAMINDKPTVLAPSQQKLLTRWAILKAMVRTERDAGRARQLEHFAR